MFANLEHFKESLGRPHILRWFVILARTSSRGARGSNAILGDVDVMVTLSGDTVKTATVTKANDMAEGPLFSFKSGKNISLRRRRRR